MFEGIEIQEQKDYLPLIILFICAVALSIVNFGYKRKLNAQIGAFFNPRMVGQVMREESSSTQLPMILLMLNGIMSVSLLVYVASKHFEIASQFGQELYFLLFGAFVGIVLFMMVVSALVNFYVRADGGLSEYRYNILVFVQILGLIFMPLSLLAAYSSVGSETAIMIGLGFFTVVYLVRIFRSFVIGLENRVSIVYIILYLCTLEILPLVVIFGLLNGEIVEIN